MLVSALALLGLAAAPALALDTLYDSASFELPRFLLESDLAGQDAPPLGSGPWLQDDGTSIATIHSNNPVDGLQSVRVQRDGAATGDTRWGVHAPFAPTTAAHVITIDVDMHVLIAADLDPTTPDFGPLFGVEAYGDASGSPGILGGFALDANTGELLYREARTATWVGSGQFFTRNAYHHYALSLDFKAKTYTVAVDGAPVVTERLVTRKLTQFTDAPIFTAAAAAPTETGTAYFDNYVITTTADPADTNLIPLPLTSAFSPAFLLAAAPAALLLRKRRPNA
jgi:hypothetical protein